MPSKKLFISIKPRYADLIFNGAKTVELRRRLPKIANGDTVIFYVSAPVMHVIGTATVKSVEADNPSLLWKRVHSQAGVTKEEFDVYFTGADQAIAIHLKNPKTFKNPVTLEALRRDFSLNPPQSFRYLTDFAIA